VTRTVSRLHIVSKRADMKYGFIRASLVALGVRGRARPQRCLRRPLGVGLRVPQSPDVIATPRRRAVNRLALAGSRSGLWRRGLAGHIVIRAVDLDRDEASSLERPDRVQPGDRSRRARSGPLRRRGRPSRESGTRRTRSDPLARGLAVLARTATSSTRSASSTPNADGSTENFLPDLRMPVLSQAPRARSVSEASQRSRLTRIGVMARISDAL
jgi:hypothetical protein